MHSWIELDSQKSLAQPLEWNTPLHEGSLCPEYLDPNRYFWFYLVSKRKGQRTSTIWLPKGFLS